MLCAGKQYKNSLLCCSKSSRLTRDSTRERRGLIGQSTEERQLQLSCHVIVKLTSPSCDVSSKHGGNCCSLPITPPTELLTRDTSGPFNLFHDDSCLSTWVWRHFLSGYSLARDVMSFEQSESSILVCTRTTKSNTVKDIFAWKKCFMSAKGTIIREN